MARIALDAMGGDHAPDHPVAAAVAALKELSPEHEIVLVGPQERLAEALSGHNGVADRIRISHASQVVGPTDQPTVAFRTKPDSSIAVGLRLHQAGEADAFVSGGNTGAVMVASTLILGLHPGLDRPAIAVSLPTMGDPVLLLDAGANVDCSAGELLGFARIGATFARDVMDRADPAVGLLSIGGESEKGNSVVKEAHGLIAADPSLRFVGNVEGQEILECKADVIVCDGFVGNVLLKFYESVGGLFRHLFSQESSAEGRTGASARQFHRLLDYGTYGGAPLLGVRGVSMICHGRSPVSALKNGIIQAAHAVENHLSQHVGDQFARAGVKA